MGDNMKIAARQMMIAMCVSIFVCAHVNEENSASPSSAELYQHMHKAGLISDEQYMHALETSSLSTGTSQF